MPTKDTYITDLPEKYVAMSPEKVAKTLMANPIKITELFGETVGIFLSSSLSCEAMHPVVMDTLCRLIAPTQKILQLQEHTYHSIV